MKQELKEKLGETIIVLWFLIFIMQDKLNKNIFLVLAWLSLISETILFMRSISNQQNHFPTGYLYLYLIFLLLNGILFACHSCKQIRAGSYSAFEIETE
jgi:hypothetical protein